MPAVCSGVPCCGALVLSAGAARRESGALFEARLAGAGGVDCHQVVVSVVPLYLDDDGGGRLGSPGQVFE